MWTQGVEKNKKIVRDEVGILRYVHDVSPTSKKIYLVIEYEREHYVGTLIFDDIPLRTQAARPQIFYSTQPADVKWLLLDKSLAFICAFLNPLFF
jgi:hypothetical protein